MPFQPGYSPLEQRIEHLEREFVRLGQSGQNANQQAQGASGTGLTAIVGGGATGVLAGDVAGPEGANAVEALQEITLTLTSPVTGQVLTYNGTAIVNSSTITGDLTITGVTTTGGFRTAVTAKSGNYTLVYTDEFVEADASGAGFTLTLPTAVGHAGQQFEIKKIDSTVNPVTVATTGGQTIDGGSTAVILMPQTSLTFRSNNLNWDLV